MVRGGKGGRGRGRGRGGGRGGRDNRHGEDNRVKFSDVPKSNEKLERYYNKVLGISDEEREEFWDALKRELPNSFRFAGSKGQALSVRDLLKERYIPEIAKITNYDGSVVEPPRQVTWYPDELAWWMTTPKNVIRRFPPFAAFQKFLVSETSVGHISRQEVVSMIPPLVMDLQPGMVVLDMCAAPGSKAAQLLEMVHRGEEARVHKSLQQHAEEDGREASPGVQIKLDEAEDLEVDSSDNGRATGLLIANDSDYKRSHMLIHQLKRLSSPNLLVTNHDATMFPSIKLPPSVHNPSVNQYLKFDRILADVPCSGDGTLRKNVNLWDDWSPSNALGLHVTQVRILVRALQMLKPGGRVVYSTCSMNPVENEAVVASAIERCGGSEKVELCPTGDKLPLLKRCPGLKDWTVMDKTGHIFSSYDEVKAYESDHGPTPATDKLIPGMFTPESSIPLENCMRVYAHQQDTGGFFICILEKMTEFKAKPEKPEGERKAATKAAAAESRISAIVNEIQALPIPKDGESLLPKIDAADAITETTISNDQQTAASRQNRENTPPEAAFSNGAKRSGDDAGLDAAMETKKLRTKEDVDVADVDGTDKAVHDPPPPGAELGLTTRPGDMRPETQTRQVRNRAGQQFEEPFKYIDKNHEQVVIIEDFYKLSPRFPRDRFMVRNPQGEPAKTIYYTSALIRDILTENEGAGIKFIHGGVKMFMKQDVQSQDVCKWRIQSEGMPILEGYVGEERVVRLYKRETLRKLLIEMFPKVSDGAWKNLGEIGEHVSKIGMGCCVLRIEPSDDPEGFKERTVLPLWRSMHSLNLMLAKEDRTAMLLRIFDDTTPLVNNHNPKQKREEEERKAANDESKEVGNGFKIENGDIKVDVVNGSLEAAAPTTEVLSGDDREIKPGPYGEVVITADDQNTGQADYAGNV